MDILAGMLAYVAGIGTLFAALAVSFFVFLATPHEPLQTETQPQNARAMLVRPSTANKPEARAKQTATQSASHFDKPAEKHAAAAGSSVTAQAAALARDPQRKHATSAAQVRRLIQEEHALRWAYQQDSSFESRFLGYAD